MARNHELFHVFMYCYNALSFVPGSTLSQTKQYSWCMFFLCCSKSSVALDNVSVTSCRVPISWSSVPLFRATAIFQFWSLHLSLYMYHMMVSANAKIGEYDKQSKVEFSLLNADFFFESDMMLLIIMLNKTELLVVNDQWL